MKYIHAMNGTSEVAGNQAGPCGILCGSCPLGNGTIAETAGQAKKQIKDYQIPVWAPLVPEGKEVDWAQVEKGLDWLMKYARCIGCESGGGPPDCPIRICARERGHQLCSSCRELESCIKFDWLKDHGSQLKEALKEERGLSKEQYIKKMAGRMPWEPR